MIKKVIFIQLVLLFCFLSYTKAQIGIKTSVTQLATTTLNIEASIPVSKKISLHLPVSYNPFVFKKNTRLQQLSCLPGVRFWKQQTNVHYFLSTYGIVSRFHFGGLLNIDYRYDGEVYGGGIGGGYAWVIGKQWNIETEVGIGVGYMEYDKCHWSNDSRRFKRFSGVRIFPAKIDLSVCYFF